MISNEAMKNILLRAKFYISSGWIKGQYARGPDGRHIGWNCTEACSFCIMGAVSRSKMEHRLIDRGSSEIGIDEKIFDSIHSLFPRRYGSISIFNDDPDTSIEMVQAVLDKAIKSYENDT